MKEAASDILKHLSDAQFTGPWRDIAPGRIDVLFLNAAVAKTERSLISTAPNGVAESAASGADIFRDPQGRYEETALVNHVGKYSLSVLVSSSPRLTVVSLLPPYSQPLNISLPTSCLTCCNKTVQSHLESPSLVHCCTEMLRTPRRWTTSA